MSFAPIEFAEALKETAQIRRHLLLGNGFSMDVTSRFNYPSLRTKAIELQGAGILRGDRDVSALIQEQEGFEAAMLRAGDSESARIIRQWFADTIAYVHPRRDEVITPEMRHQCSQFLALFAKKAFDRAKGSIFTTNYDALLYWVLSGSDRKVLGWVSDGLYWPRNYSSAAFANAQVFYLHGALHIYERESPDIHRGLDVVKERAGGDDSLVDRVRRRILAGEMPLFVSEGHSQGKLKRIGESAFLRVALAQFRRACMNPADALFIIGHGLSQYDQHLVDSVANSRIRRVYVGWHSNDEHVRDLADQWDRTRPSEFPIEVKAFCTRGLPMWRTQP